MSTTGGTLKSTTNEQRKWERNKALLSQGQNNIGHIIQFFFFDRPDTDVRGGLPDKPFVGVYNNKKSTPKLVYSRQFARS